MNATTRLVGRVTAFALCAAVLMGLLQCTDSASSNGGTETGDAVLAGMVYQSDGQTPAANVTVCVRVRSSLADTAGAGQMEVCVTTDASGRYRIEGIGPGVYVVEAVSGNDMALADSVVVTDPSVTNNLDPDTLRTAGAIRGVVYLSEGHDPRTVLVLAYGIDRLARVASDGAFCFAGLAQAAYDLRFVSTLDNYGVLDMAGVQVSAGDTTELGTVELPFKGVPIPKNVTLDYDTLRQIVTLTWDRADTSLVAGYNVHRKHVDSGFVMLNGAPVADTVYRDSGAVQDRAYEYRVQCVDTGDNGGRMSAAAVVTIASVFSPVGRLGGSGTAPGLFAEIGDVHCLRSGALAAVDRAANRVQVFDGAGSLVRAWGQQGSLDGEFESPIAVTEDDSGLLYVLEMEGAGRVQRFDSLGQYLRSWGVGPQCRGIAHWAQRLYIATSIPPGLTILDLRTDTSVFVAMAGTNPFRIAVDSGLAVYTTDDAGKKILRGDTTGVLAAEWGDIGTRNGEFETPSGICIDPKHRVFVADAGNGRVQVFDQSGQFITRLVLATPSAGSQQVDIDLRPRAIAFDAAGRLLVADAFFVRSFTVALP